MALAPPPAALTARRRISFAALPQWWHLLSLDAPTVAALWSWSIARALDIHLPLSSPLLLALGTWLVYVADRILDGIFVDSPGALRERHFFYARHRRAFLIAAVPAGFLLIWLIAAHMNPFARREDVAVLGVALLYFSIVHIHGQSAERWLPKELVVGVIFAMATAVPAWSRLEPRSAHGTSAERVVLILIALSFASLCWLNCVAIEKWERRNDSFPNHLSPHPTTLWAQFRFQRLAIGLALAACAGAFLSRLLVATPAAPAIFLACALTSAGFAGLDSWQKRLNLGAFHLRIAADAVMLTPLLFAVVLR